MQTAELSYWGKELLELFDLQAALLKTNKNYMLGTWLENASYFKAGTTTTGVVRSIENYGIFVELAPNLAGLAELKEGVRVGDSACVYIKAIIPEKMKVKLIIVNSCPDNYLGRELDYYIKKGRIKSWLYSTDNAPKYIATEFY